MHTLNELSVRGCGALGRRSRSLLRGCGVAALPGFLAFRLFAHTPQPTTPRPLSRARLGHVGASWLAFLFTFRDFALQSLFSTTPLVCFRSEGR